MTGPTYTVGQLARMSGTSVRTLHHYEQMGLLVPARRENGYRVYTSADAARLQQDIDYMRQSADGDGHTADLAADVARQLRDAIERLK